MAAYATDIIFEDGANNVLLKGHDPMRERYGALFSGNPELHCRILNRMRIGKYIVDEEEISGISKAPAPRHTIVIYRVKDEKIVHVRVLG
jgi:hypothetical protein